MRLGSLAFVFVLAACSSSEPSSPGGEADTGGVDDAVVDATTDGESDAEAPGTDAATGSDGSEPEDTGTTTDTGDEPDGAGVKCGDAVCPVGQLCCVTSSGGVLDFQCDTSCADAGGTISCDGPEDCSSEAPICCANVAIGGTFPACEFNSGDASCKSSCDTTLPPSLPSTCPAGATVRACKKEADCTEPSFGNCCEFSDGVNTATFCAPNYMLGLAVRCF